MTFSIFAAPPGANKYGTFISLSQFLRHLRMQAKVTPSSHFPNLQRLHVTFISFSQLFCFKYAKKGLSIQRCTQNEGVFSKSTFFGYIANFRAGGGKSENGFSIDEIQVLCPIGLFSTNGKQKQIIYIKRCVAIKI